MLEFNKDKCIGCKLCQIVCSGSKEGKFSPSLARLVVDSIYKDKDLIIETKICTLCEECVDTCPTSAITMLNGHLNFNRDECINCGVCVDGCPEKVIIQKEDFIGLCDLCEGDPLCVKFCPHGALEYKKVSTSEEAI